MSVVGFVSVNYESKYPESGYCSDIEHLYSATGESALDAFLKMVVCVDWKITKHPVVVRIPGKKVQIKFPLVIRNQKYTGIINTDPFDAMSFIALLKDPFILGSSK